MVGNSVLMLKACAKGINYKKKMSNIRNIYGTDVIVISVVRLNDALIIPLSLPVLAKPINTW